MVVVSSDTVVADVSTVTTGFSTVVVVVSAYVRGKAVSEVAVDTSTVIDASYSEATVDDVPSIIADVDSTSGLTVEDGPVTVVVCSFELDPMMERDTGLHGPALTFANPRTSAKPRTFKLAVLFIFCSWNRSTKKGKDDKLLHPVAAPVKYEVAWR